jgi:hypothetical protein
MENDCRCLVQLQFFSMPLSLGRRPLTGRRSIGAFPTPRYFCGVGKAEDQFVFERKHRIVRRKNKGEHYE